MGAVPRSVWWLTVPLFLGNLHIPSPTFPKNSLRRGSSPSREASEGGISIHEESRKLSPRQQRVISLVAKGLKNREIAKKLGIGEHVVRNYLGIIYDKIGVSNRVELALWYHTRLQEKKLRRR